MKLLIVDDSALIRRSIENVYRGQTFTEIKTASDGLLAVTLYKEFAPDVVTLDITMPYMDGLAALTEMLAFNERAQILVISALADHHTAIEALKRGATQFICKPFTDEDLREALDDLVLSVDHNPAATAAGGQTPSECDSSKRLLERTRVITTQVKSTAPIAQPQPLSPPQPQPPAPPAPAAHNYPSGYVQPPVVGTTSEGVEIRPITPPAGRNPLFPPQDPQS